MFRQAYEFDDFRISSVRRLVWRAGEQIHLSGREFDTLLALIQQAGTPIRGDVLTKEVWQDEADHAGNLRRQVSVLRRKLGKDANGNDYIRTIPNYGYQFASSVVCREEAAPIPTPVVEDAAPMPEPGRLRFAWPVIAVAVVALVIGSAFAWQSWPKDVQLLGCRQLTRDGLVKVGRVFTDGDRYYVTELVKGNYVIASLPLNGGAADYLKFPWASTDAVGSSISRHSLLVSNNAKHDLWELELGSQTLRQIPLPREVKPDWAVCEPAGNRLAVETEGNTLVVFEPWKNLEPVRFPFPGLMDLSGWDSRGGRLRFAVFDPVTEMSRWWELTGTDRTPRLLAHFSSARIEREGAWTSDGRFFIFWAANGRHQKNSQLSIADGHSSHSYRLTIDDVNWRFPTPVPGANSVLALGRRSEGQLVTLATDGRATIGKPLLPGVPAYEVDYSRDGKWMTYTLFPEHTIWRCRLDGGDAKQLSPPGVVAHQPHWSPDGTRIAFMGKHDSPGARWRIYLVPGSGGNTDEPLPEGDDQGVPTWSGDGRSLFFGDFSKPYSPEHRHIHELSLQTRMVTTVPGPTDMWSPRMSPDGKYLAAVSSDNKSLYVRDNLHNTWRKCVSLYLVAEPIWPRDSSWIQFIGQPTRTETYLYRVGPNCEQPHQVVDVSQISFVGDAWYGIAPDHSPSALVSVPYEVYALDWRLRRRLP